MEASIQLLAIHQHWIIHLGRLVLEMGRPYEVALVRWIWHLLRALALEMACLLSE
jgi:hypothetical protein